MGNLNVGNRWFVIHEQQIMGLLKSAFEGTNPDIVMLELEANSSPGETDE